MVRDAPAAGVHSCHFAAPDYMDREIDIDGAPGCVFAVALYQDDNVTAMMPWSGVGWYDYWTGTTIGPSLFDLRDAADVVTSYSFRLSGGRPAALTWVDYVWVWSSSRQQFEMYLNGELVHTLDTAANVAVDMTAGNLRLGAYQTGAYNWLGKLALPEVLAADLPLEDLQSYMAWRRSIHGIY
jgi:hypothetical protein